MNTYPLPNENVISAGIFTLTTAINCELRVRQRRLTDYLNAAEEHFFIRGEGPDLGLSRLGILDAVGAFCSVEP